MLYFYFVILSLTLAKQYITQMRAVSCHFLPPSIHPSIFHQHKQVRFVLGNMCTDVWVVNTHNELMAFNSWLFSFDHEHHQWRGQAETLWYKMCLHIFPESQNGIHISARGAITASSY